MCHRGSFTGPVSRAYRGGESQHEAGAALRAQGPHSIHHAEYALGAEQVCSKVQGICAAAGH